MTSSGRTDAAQTLEARQIVVAFGGLRAIDDVSVNLAPGEVFGLIGPNGKVLLGGVDLTGRSADQVARQGLARTFQAVRLFRDLLVIENLEAAAVGSGLGRREARQRAMRVLEWIRFEHKAQMRADSLPYGEERRVGIARALATAPKYVLLDEPAAGLSDAECDDLMDLIGRIPAQFGCGVLLIEHNMRVVMGACGRVQVIDGGKTIAEGTPEEIQRHDDVIRAYLGTKSGRDRARGR